jgi:ABC-type sugar transport system ATPase subunit
MNFLSIDSQLAKQLSGFSDLPAETELGFRPEQVTAGETGELTLSCQVVSIQQLGAENLVTLCSGEQQFIMRSGERELPNLDASLVVSLPADGIHCFSSVTGKRLGMLGQLADNQPSSS